MKIRPRGRTFAMLMGITWYSQWHPLDLNEISTFCLFHNSNNLSCIKPELSASEAMTPACSLFDKELAILSLKLAISGKSFPLVLEKRLESNSTLLSTPMPIRVILIPWQVNRSPVYLRFPLDPAGKLGNGAHVGSHLLESSQAFPCQPTEFRHIVSGNAITGFHSISAIKVAMVAEQSTKGIWPTTWSWKLDQHSERKRRP